jgi:hypothetical protein
MRRLLFLGVIGLLLGACSTAGPVRQFTKGDEVAYYDFNTAGSFEEAIYGDGVVRLSIGDGVYTISLAEGDSELWYGQWGDTYRDVVVDVEAQQFTQSENTIYGVMCRVRGMVGQTVANDPELEALAAQVGDTSSLFASADATDEATAEVTEAAPEVATEEATAEATSEAEIGDEAAAETNADVVAEGTLEVVDDSGEEATVEATEAVEQATDEPEEVATEEATADPTQTGDAAFLNVNNGDGYLFLLQSSGRFAIMRARGRSVTPLVDWTNSGAINTGPAENRIRAVCLGDYLALYVNGTFLGDATDDTYTQGQVGLVGATGDRLGLVVEFDNLSVSAVTPG